MSKYTLKNEEGSERASLYIYGEIVNDRQASIYQLFGIDGVVGATDFRKQLEAVGDKPLDVYISSDGGEVPSGLAIANMLARRTAETVGHIDGWAASIAGIIFLACHERHMPGNTFLMLHRPSLVGFDGNIDDFQKAVEFLDTTGKSMLNFIFERLNHDEDKETVEKNYIDEHWYSAQEATEFFRIQTDSDQSYKAVAKCSRFKLPAALKANMANDKPVAVAPEIMQALNDSLRVIYDL